MSRSVGRPGTIAAAALLGVAFGAGVLLAQQSQNPSPMVEHTRPHPRLPEVAPEGRRETLQLGTGSGAYGKPFADPQLFGRIVAEAEAKSHLTFSPIILTSWSAGYGAVRAILKVPENYKRVDRVLLIDGMHASYVGDMPGTGPGQESVLVPEDLDIFAQFARDAVAGRKRMIVTHSEIFPGTFASTTETTDWLVTTLGLKLKAVLKWGPIGLQQLSEARAGNFQLLGYAGNSAPDHVDQLQALPDFLKWLK